MAPDLDQWLPKPLIRVAHRRESHAPPERLWSAAQRVTVEETAVLGRLIRWRIPGTPPGLPLDELFRSPPFIPLQESDAALVSGLVGRIWTLRRDYPKLSHPDEFRDWSQRGTARVLLANWVEPAADEQSAVLASEARVEAIGAQGRVGVAAVKPLVRAFHHLIGSDGIGAAVREAERSTP